MAVSVEQLYSRDLGLPRMGESFESKIAFAEKIKKSLIKSV